MNWEHYRNADGTIDLIGAFRSQHRGINTFKIRKAEEFLSQVTDLYPVASRQAAAIAVAHALNIALERR